MKKSELVAATAELLKDRRRWTKDYSSVDSGGQFTASVTSANAVAWCLSGAIRRELILRHLFVPDLELEAEIVEVFREQFPEFRRRFTIPGFNDEPAMTHEGMLMVLGKVHTQLVERGE